MLQVAHIELKQVCLLWCLSCWFPVPLYIGSNHLAYLTTPSVSLTTPRVPLQHLLPRFCPSIEASFVTDFSTFCHSITFWYILVTFVTTNNVTLLSPIPGTGSALLPAAPTDQLLWVEEEHSVLLYRCVSMHFCHPGEDGAALLLSVN